MTHAAILDANLLCLLVVGRIDTRLIAFHKRLRTFDRDAFLLLNQILADRDLVLCPHVLAETSNLLDFHQSPTQVHRLRTSLAEIVALASERSEAARRAVDDPAYSRLGLSDAVMLLLASDRTLLLVSDDLALCLEAQRRGSRVVNYSHVRDGAIGLDQLP